MPMVSIPRLRLAFLVLFTAACQDAVQPTERTRFQAYVIDRGQAGGELVRFPELSASLEDIRVDRSDLPPEESDNVLVEKVRRAGGVVHIGFKQPTRGTTRLTGIVPGMSRTEALAYRSQITTLGGELLQTFRNLTAVVVRIPPELAPEVRRLSFVNYVEAETYGKTSANLAQDTTSQDTSWGPV